MSANDDNRRKGNKAMNEVIIDEAMVDAINLAAEELWRHVRPSDECEEGDGVYFIDGFGDCVPEQCWEEVWGRYPEHWRKVWQVSGDMDVVGMSVREVVRIWNDPDWTPDVVFYTEATGGR